MKKRILAALLIASMLAAVSCGETKTGDDEAETNLVNETFSAETDASETNVAEDAETVNESYNYMGNDLSAFITVGNYKGLNVTTTSTELTDEEYAAELASLINSYAYTEKITDRAVEEGDTVVTSYAGYMDGVQFQGGTSESSEVTAADGTGYIDGFGPAFIGKMPGEEFSFQVTFPSVYGNLELAGKEVTFVCTISHIKGTSVIVPELTDQFVRENFGYETVEVFEEQYREYLALQKEYNVENTMGEELWAQVVEASTVLGYPEGELDRYCDIVKKDVAQTAAMYGLEYADFLTNYLGMTEEALNEVALQQAKEYVKENLILYQIAKAEGILITEERFNEEVNKAAEMNSVTADVIIQYYGKDTIMLSLIQQEVFADIIDAANVTVEETTAETTAE